MRDIPPDPVNVRRPEHLPEGQVLPIEGRWLRHAAAAVKPPDVIVELGSYTGKSASCLAAGSNEGLQARIFAIDLWTAGTSHKGANFRRYDPDVDGPVRSSSKFHSPTVREKFTTRMERWDPRHLVMPVEAPSAEPPPFMDGLQVALLFIDAEHTYEAVQADWQAWEGRVTPSGLIACHDYAGKEPGAGVPKFIDGVILPEGRWRIREVVGSMAVLCRH